jgi:hypothetical protein
VKDLPTYTTPKPVTKRYNIENTSEKPFYKLSAQPDKPTSGKLLSNYMSLLDKILASNTADKKIKR